MKKPTPATPATRRTKKAIGAAAVAGNESEPSEAEMLKQLLAALTAFKRGDFSARLPEDWLGVSGKVADTFNEVIRRNQELTSELARIGAVVGVEGRIGQRASLGDMQGSWSEVIGSVNSLVENLVQPTSEMARVIGSVAKGDLSQSISTELDGRPLKGEFMRTARTVNTMVEQLGRFASEVTRVAREVGTEGKLGGQARVKGVAGTWKDLTDNVNLMAGNLTAQVRNIATVTTAVANGDLTKKITVDVKGEFLELKDTVNTMVGQLRSFASEVTRVAREVGSEGALGGQARVEGVATAVTKGDLTQSIQVTARGEVAFVKDNINEMIRNLRDTTSRNEEQNWLKTNLAKFTRMLQGQKDLLTVGKLILSELAPVVSAQTGIFYIMDNGATEPELRLLASYAFNGRKHLSNRYSLGEGLVGQCALEKQPILLTNVPADYIQISSGLGEAAPMNLMVLPIIFEDKVKAVIELASFQVFNPTHEAFLVQLSESIGIVLNTIKANSLTEDLLKQSQSLAGELQNRQDELERTNSDLQDKAAQLAEQNAEVERKNSEVEQARTALEGKAQQLALTSKYKSEFLANMSHELRTPLNSLLILAEQLGSNHDGNLTQKQLEFAHTILGSGRDLLRLINDILDLSRIESGNFTVTVGEVRLDELMGNIDRTFRHVAEEKGLGFKFEIAPELPKRIFTDQQRLDQILKNLLSNALKFTESGEVSVKVSSMEGNQMRGNAVLRGAPKVLAFSVADSGIGIHPDKQMVIFEAFQQADGSTNRRYGGSGLGLAISRELARLLGGEISVESEEGKGSTFTLFLPVHAPREAASADDADAPKEAIEYAGEAIEDDRSNISPLDRVVLIAEDNPETAGLLLDRARAKGYKGVVATRGHSALNFAREFQLDGITLDVSLPDMDGWKVLTRLKSDINTRHIPVFVVSADAEPENALKNGAVRFLGKPLATENVDEVFAHMRRMHDNPGGSVLLVEDDETQRDSIRKLLDDTPELQTASNGAEALELLGANIFDCVVVDLILPDTSGFDLIREIRREHPQIPIIVYTGKDVGSEEEAQLNRLTQTMIVKDVRSPERLYDQVALWLHRKVAALPQAGREMVQRLNDPNTLLAGKKVLIVDDEVRNIFAMTSVLERFQMEVMSTELGEKAIDLLGDGYGFDVVLMDIMMPKMDGYEVMKTIRGMDGFQKLPIIALTAKAMKGDREKCIDAGASDYISKPVDTDRLLTMLRTWLYR